MHPNKSQQRKTLLNQKWFLKQTEYKKHEKNAFPGKYQNVIKVECMEKQREIGKILLTL